MPVTYIKASPYFERVFEDHVPNLSVLFFDPVLERSATPFGDRFRRIDPTTRAGVDLVVVRGGSEDFQNQVFLDPILQAVLGRVPLFTLAPGLSAEGLATMKVARPPWSAEFQGTIPTLECLREIEVLSIIERGEAIWNTPQEYHFALPSGYHAREFVRIGDALCDTVEIARLTDWLVPYIRPNSVLLADTGSILPLLLSAQFRVQQLGFNVVVEALNSYPGGTEAISRTLLDVNHRTGKTNPPVLLVVSVNSTGRLVRTFKSLATECSGVVVVCNTSENLPTDSAEIFARYPTERWNVDSSGRCEKCGELQKLDIHPHSYQRVLSRDCELVKLTWAVAQEHQVFWEAADATEAIRLHADVPYSDATPTHSRHLPIFIDVGKLLLDATFRRRCLAELRKIPQPDNVLIPRHPASQAVQDLVCEALRAESDFPLGNIHIVPGGRLPEALCRIIAGSKRILIADDALVNGGTLMGLREEIYRATQPLGVTPRIDAFVVVARPSDKAKMEAVRRRFRGTGEIHYAELIFLPSSQSSEKGRYSCPWCYESTLLRQYLGKLSGPSAEHAQCRLKTLQGLAFAPVSRSEDKSDRESSALTTVGSYFGTLHPVPAFAAAASAAQALFTEIEGHGIGSRRRIVDVRMLLDAYFETVLLGAIMRTLPEYLLRWNGQDAAVSEFIGGIDASRAYPGLIGEIGWAAVSGKLPKRAVAELLARIPDPAPDMLMLREILALQLEISL